MYIYIVLAIVVVGVPASGILLPVTCTTSEDGSVTTEDEVFFVNISRIKFVTSGIVYNYNRKLCMYIVAYRPRGSYTHFWI